MKNTEKIISLISSTSNWEQLNRDFLEYGLLTEVYRNRRKFVDLVKKLWQNNNYYKEQSECFPLPGTIVSLGSRDYFIHGLPHDNLFVSIPDEFKQLINQQLRRYNVICEDGFCEWIENSISFGEIEYFGLNKFDILKTLKAILEIFQYKVTIHSKNKVIKKVEKLRTIEDLRELRKTLFLSYLPEPLGMNSYLYLENIGTIDHPHRELPFVVRKYFYEAKKSIEYAESNEIKELHIVVGCRHERPLEYLIKHADDIL